MKIETRINQFLEKKKNAWSLTTIKSNEAFLNKYASLIMQEDPLAFFNHLKSEGKNAYTIQTYFIHAGNFYEFLYPSKENVFRIYRKENRNVFKNAYQTKHVPVTYEEVRHFLETAEESPERDAALYLLKTAQRASEAGLARRIGEHQPNSGDLIVGKGGKQRVNLGEGLTRNVSYYKVYQYTKHHLGISPHALRKLALTRASERGANVADLCEIAGWSSISTAIRYLQPKRKAQLKSYLD